MKKIFMLLGVLSICFAAEAEKVSVKDPNKQIEIVGKNMAKRGNVQIKALNSIGNDQRGYFVSVDLVYKASGKCQMENLADFWEDAENNTSGFTWLLNGGQDCRTIDSN